MTRACLFQPDAVHCATITTLTFSCVATKHEVRGGRQRCFKPLKVRLTIHQFTVSIPESGVHST
eukprot:m.1123651 g.1123651  ORF g.1123651 m.1123651 type:complete len:64 (-) comp24405_c2_seq2:142-333(-)